MIKVPKKWGQFSSPVSPIKFAPVAVAQVQQVNLPDKNIIELETNIWTKIVIDDVCILYYII